MAYNELLIETRKREDRLIVHAERDWDEKSNYQKDPVVTNSMTGRGQQHTE